MSGKVLSSQRRRGLTPVISTIIISAVVIAVGGAVWAYSQGASTVIANDYVNSTLDLMNEVIERFIVEHVSNSSNGDTLHIYVYNYGDVDIVVDVYANATHFVNATYSNFTYCSDLEYSIAAKGVIKIELSFSSCPLDEGDEVAVKIHSRRQNNAYYKYYVN